MQTMNNPVIIFGANALGRAAQEIFNSHDIVVYCFLDDNSSLHGQEFNEVNVLGKTDDAGYLKFIGKKCQAFIAEDNNKARKSLVKMLNDNRKVMPVNAVHSDASVSITAHLGHGNFINNGVVVSNNAKISNHCLIQSGAIIDFEAELADFVQIGAGCTIGSEVKIEEEVFIGTGVTIVPGVTIGKGARVGAGSVVVSNIKKGETVFGNPAQIVEA